MLGRIVNKLRGQHLTGLKDGRERSRDEIHEYWQAPSDGSNKPTDYVDPQGGQQRSRLLLSLVEGAASPSDAILEVGTNVGRNLHHLYTNSYTNLTGIEISAEAVAELRRQYPDTAANARILNQPAEEALLSFSDREFPLVFTMAVLVHIHPDSAGIVFPEIARVADRTLIVIEDERSVHSWRHFQRNYQEVFEPLGFRQVREEPCNRETHGLPSEYQLRIFERA